MAGSQGIERNDFECPQVETREYSIVSIVEEFASTPGGECSINYLPESRPDRGRLDISTVDSRIWASQIQDEIQHMNNSERGNDTSNYVIDIAILGFLGI